MRKPLTLCQLFSTVFALLLSYFDGMFTWTANTYMPPLHSRKQQFSLENLMTVQEVPPGALAYRIFMVSLLVMLLVCVLQLAVRHDQWERRILLILPVISFLLLVLMVSGIHSYSNSFSNNGELFFIHISCNITAYLEFLLIGAAAVIEWYKQFQCFD